MAIERIEEYRQQNNVDILKVYIKPTKAFPSGGYFYSPAEAIDLVKEKGWFLVKSGNGVVLMSRHGVTNTYFHQELCKFYHGMYVDCIDHVNMVEIDNTDENLNAVSSKQNLHNRFIKGYSYRADHNRFTPRFSYDFTELTKYEAVYTENEACILQNVIENEIYKELNDFYIFDFKKYRRGSEDILDLERTGQISEEEAVYRHILKYSDNAWYMLRYGLEDYYKENHIPIPQYSLDSNGFMVHPITGQKLCPFIK